MGLDMYIYKAPKVKEFATFEDMRQALDIYNELKGYKESLYVLEHPEAYNTKDFWSIHGEDEETKRIRVFDELKEYVSRSKTLYEENKNRFADKQLEEMKNYRESQVNVAYWRKFYDLNDYILENFVPEELQGTDMNCVPFELTKDNIVDILNAINNYEITQDEDEIEYTAKELSSLLEDVDFDKEILLYHEWY